MSISSRVSYETNDMVVKIENCRAIQNANEKIDQELERNRSLFKRMLKTECR